MDGINPSNPKQRYGDLKVPLGLVPSSSIIYEAMALKQGAEKYGPYNWRETGVEAMTYVHAAERHLRAWLDGEALDRDSGMPHLGHAKACLGILIDADECDKLIDNRPPPAPTHELLEDFTAGGPTVSELMQRRNKVRWGEGMFGPAPDDYPFTSHRTMAEIMETEERQNAAFGEGDETPMPTGDDAHARAGVPDGMYKGLHSEWIGMTNAACQLDGRNCPPDHEHGIRIRDNPLDAACDAMTFGTGAYVAKWEAMTKRPCMCERGRCKVDNGWTLGLDMYCCQGERG